MSSSYIAIEVHNHFRSVSLPSRPHPSSHDIEIELKNKLKSLEASIDTSTSLEANAINSNLTRLAHLYNCVEELIDFPLTQKALVSQYHHKEEKHLLEEALDMSIGLIDVCGSSRELLLLMKEHVQEIQSAMRRKGLDSSIKGQICAYICFRKRARKEISKILKQLKKMESGLMFKSSHSQSLVTIVLRELSIVTILFFRKLLVFMCPQVLKKNVHVWSLLFSREKRVTNEMGEIDESLCSLHRNIRKNDAKDDLEVVNRRLEEVDGGIRELEAGLGCLFRCLIRNRVSLLNLLTP